MGGVTASSDVPEQVRPGISVFVNSEILGICVIAIILIINWISCRPERYAGFSGMSRLSLQGVQIDTYQFGGLLPAVLTVRIE